MRVCGRHFNTELIGRIQSAVDVEPSLSRRALSRRVCGWAEWQTAEGKAQEVGCRKALAELDRRGVLHLPPTVAGPCRGRGRRVGGAAAVPEVPELTCSLEEVGAVEIVVVPSRHSPLSGVWNELLDAFHYLGKGPLCGAQLRYLVRSARHGWLGALSFSAATWRLLPRDRWIGWSDAARRAHLREVVCNSRFLIVPGVRVPNLASHVLSLSTRQLPADWRERYGYAPVLVETFVDPSRFDGASYRAANWVQVGHSAARRTPYGNGKVADGPKDIYLYRLSRRWRSVLCQPPQEPLCRRPAAEAPADWAEAEFGRFPAYDQRLGRRLVSLARDFAAQPGELVPQACNGSIAKAKAAYRFFANVQVSMHTVLRPHIESTIERVRQHAVVLAAQDTTTLNYGTHPFDGAGPINTKKDKAKGLLVHDTVAFTPDGTPLGLLDVQCWARDPAQAGKKHRRKELPIEEKESHKWLDSYRAVATAQTLCPDTVLVSVGDREADIYELFHEARLDPRGPQLLVRAERSRNRQVEQQHLWPRLAAEPLAGLLKVNVSRKGGRPARTATAEVRYAHVLLAPPKDSALPPVAVWAVQAREIDPPAHVKEPIDWMLLGTVPTGSYQEACERLRWYSRRWGIEEYHRVLKSGCRIEDRQLEERDSIASCLAVDMVVAWRVCWLTKGARETPEATCEPLLSRAEWEAISAWATRRPPPAEPPTMRQVARWVGKLGGHLGRKGDGEPGTTCLWRGLARLPYLAEGWSMQADLHPARASPGPAVVRVGPGSRRPC
jgi:hypothetical protein